MTDQNEQAAPAVEDALPQIFMSREKLLYTFPGGEPYEVNLQAALQTTKPEQQGRITIALLWFMNVQMHTLVTMMQQASEQAKDPEAIAAAAMSQMRSMVPGFDELFANLPGGAQAKVKNLLRGAGKGLG